MRVLQTTFVEGFGLPPVALEDATKESNGAVIYLRQNMVCMQNFRIFSWQLRAHVLPSSCVVAHFEPSVDVVGLLFSCLCIKRELQEKQYQRYVYTYLHPHTYQCPFIRVYCTQKNTNVHSHQISATFCKQFLERCAWSCFCGAFVCSFLHSRCVSIYVNISSRHTLQSSKQTINSIALFLEIIRLALIAILSSRFVRNQHEGGCFKWDGTWRSAASRPHVFSALPAALQVHQSIKSPSKSVFVSYACVCVCACVCVRECVCLYEDVVCSSAQLFHI